MFEAGIELDKIEEFLRRKLTEGCLQEKLTIIDPYFFSKGNFGDVQNIMADILLPFQDMLQTLEVVTSKRNCNKKSYIKLTTQLRPLSIEILYNDNFHDRFWIIDERLAFVVGASVNGFGKRHFFIQDDYLSPKDTKTILAMYKFTN